MHWSGFGKLFAISEKSLHSLGKENATCEWESSPVLEAEDDAIEVTLTSVGTSCLDFGIVAWAGHRADPLVETGIASLESPTCFLLGRVRKCCATCSKSCRFS